MNLHDFLRIYEDKITSNANNMFQQQFLIHMDKILSIIGVVENLY